MKSLLLSIGLFSFSMIASAEIDYKNPPTHAAHCDGRILDSIDGTSAHAFLIEVGTTNCPETEHLDHKIEIEAYAAVFGSRYNPILCLQSRNQASELAAYECRKLAANASYYSYCKEITTQSEYYSDRDVRNGTCQARSVFALMQNGRSF